jgi:hypothetical protein
MAKKFSRRLISTGLCGVALGALVFAPASTSVAAPASCNFTLINASFEEPNIGNDWAGKPQTDVPGWILDSRDPFMEFWGPGMMTASDGDQLIEMQYTQAVVLYQDAATTPGDSIDVTIAHRNRYGGTDHVQIEMGPVGGPYDTVIDLNDDANQWYDHSGTYIVPAGQTTTRFRMNPEVSGNSNGSLIDNIRTSCTPVNATSGVSGANGGSVSQTVTSSSKPELTNTGMDFESLLWLGAGLLFAGGVLLRRETRAKRRVARQTFR